MREGEDPDLAHHVFVPPSALILGEPGTAGECCSAPCFCTRSPGLSQSVNVVCHNCLVYFWCGCLRITSPCTKHLGDANSLQHCRAMSDKACMLCR